MKLYTFMMDIYSFNDNNKQCERYSGQEKFLYFVKYYTQTIQQFKKKYFIFHPWANNF